MQAVGWLKKKGVFRLVDDVKTVKLLYLDEAVITKLTIGRKL